MNISSPPTEAALGIEEQIAQLFAEVFERPAVATDADFFELGGDSLLGQTLISAIERDFGVVWSLSVLLEARTPIALAARMNSRAETRTLPPYLVSVRPNGIRPPVFCVHGNTGESVAPHELSAVLGNRAFYAIRGIGLEEGEEFVTSMEGFVDRYLAAVEMVQPEGDLLLLGHCAGAIIALAMAQESARRGRPPAGLILIDPETKLDFAPYLHHSGLSLTLLKQSWKKREQELSKLIGVTVDPRGDTRRTIVANGIKIAIGTYVHQPYLPPTLLLYTADRRDLLLQPNRGYPAFLRDFEAVQLSMRHGLMFTEGVAEVGAAIARFIDRLTPT